MRQAASSEAPTESKVTKVPVVVPAGHIYDAKANRLFKLTKGAPPDFVAKVRREAEDQALAARSSATREIVRLRELRMGPPMLSLSACLRRRELEFSGSSAIAPWIAGCMRSRVSAWKQTSLNLRRLDTRLDIDDVLPAGNVGASAVACHSHSGTVVAAGLSNGAMLFLSQRISAASEAARRATAWFRYGGTHSGDGSPSWQRGITSMDVSPYRTDRMLVASSALGAALDPGSISVHSFAWSAEHDGYTQQRTVYETSSRTDAQLCRGGSAWCASWVGPDALAVGVSSERPSFLARLLPDGRLLSESVIVNDDISDVFTFGTAHSPVLGPSGGDAAPSGSCASTGALYVGRRNGDVLLWDAREGKRGGRQASKVMHVESSVVAVQALTYPYVLVADAATTMQIRDCRKLSEVVISADGYSNSVKRLGVAVSDGAQFIAAACSDGAVRCWDSHARLLFASEPAPPNQRPLRLCFLPHATVDGGLGGLSIPTGAVAPLTGVPQSPAVSELGACTIEGAKQVIPPRCLAPPRSAEQGAGSVMRPATGFGWPVLLAAGETGLSLFGI